MTTYENRIFLSFFNALNISSCCESANSNTKDACCHVDGLEKNPPKWVDRTGTQLPPVVSTDQAFVGVDCTDDDGKRLKINYIFSLSNFKEIIINYKTNRMY